MTLSSTANRIKCDGDGSTKNFAFPYYYLATSDLKVVLIDANDIETLLTETTHYSVSAPSPSGGTVAMVTAPKSTEKLVIYRESPMTQGFDPEEGGPLPADEIEKSLDKLTMIVQQLSERLDRALGLPVGSALTELTVNPVASKVIGFDSGGTNLTTYSPTAVQVANFDSIQNYNDDLGAAITAIGSGVQVLVIDKAITVSADTTVPVNITLLVLPASGGAIQVAATKTVTYNCAIIAGDYQIFGGSGSHDLGGLIGTVKGKWFSGGSETLDLDGNKLILDADGDTSITADTDDQIDIEIGGTDQVSIKDGVIEPVTDNDIDIGASGKQIKDIYLEGKLIQNAVEQKAWLYNLTNQQSVSFTVDAGGLFWEIVYHVYLSDTGKLLYLTFNNDTGARYNWARHARKWEAASHNNADDAATGDGKIILSSPDLEYIQTGRILIACFSGGNDIAYVEWRFAGYESSSIIGSGKGSGYYDGTADITSIQMKQNSENFISGRAIVRQLR